MGDMWGRLGTAIEEATRDRGERRAMYITPRPPTDTERPVVIEAGRVSVEFDARIKLKPSGTVVFIPRDSIP